MDHTIHRIENQRSEYNPIGKANAESRNHERLSVRGHRRRKWAGLCMLTNHLMYIHALCADMVVSRESAAKPERICRISELCFQYKSDAEQFYERLKHRMGYFGLSLEEEKSRLIEFGRFAQERCAKRGTKPETFTFLGFTHYCSQGKNGKLRVKRKTSRKKFAKKCKEVHRLIGNMITLTMKEIIQKLNRILTGYYHYYGITDNTPSIKKFRYNVLKSLFYWINRRSQKQSYNWNEFLRTIDANYQLAKGRVYVSVYE